MDRIFYDLTAPAPALHYRFVQPPQVVFLVSTLDPRGNVNLTPVTLGTCVGVDASAGLGEGEYHFAFSVGRRDRPGLPATDAQRNLRSCPECVIAFPPTTLVDQVRAAAVPVPSGISEMDVARLTALPSRKVRPPGIAECPVNLEARVETALDLGRSFTLFVVRVVAASLDADLVTRDEARSERVGLLLVDLLFEAALAAPGNRPLRMYFTRLERDALVRERDEMGPRRAWIGTFEDWIDDEHARGRLAPAEREEILTLQRRWQQRPDPAANAEVKQRLTRWLSELLWERSAA